MIDKTERQHWLTVARVLAFCYVQTLTSLFCGRFPRKTVRGTGYLLRVRKINIPTLLHTWNVLLSSIQGVSIPGFWSNLFFLHCYRMFDIFPVYITVRFWEISPTIIIWPFFLSLKTTVRRKLFLRSFPCRARNDIHSNLSFEMRSRSIWEDQDRNEKYFFFLDPSHFGVRISLFTGYQTWTPLGIFRANVRTWRDLFISQSQFLRQRRYPKWISPTLCFWSLQKYALLKTYSHLSSTMVFPLRRPSLR